MKYNPSLEPEGMSLWQKALIAFGIVFLIFFVIPVGIAFANGKTESLQGLIETLKYILKAHEETLKAMINAYKQFLSSL